MVSHPELGSDPSIGSDRESGCDSLGERKPRVLCVKIKIVVELPCLLKFLQGCSRRRLGQGFPSDSRYVNKP